MHGLFGEIEIAEQAHERRQNPARFRSVKSLDDSVDLGAAEFSLHRRHLRQTSKRTGSTQLRASFLTMIEWPTTALIEGLQLTTAQLLVRARKLGTVAESPYEHL